MVFVLVASGTVSKFQAKNQILLVILICAGEFLKSKELQLKDIETFFFNSKSKYFGMFIFNIYFFIILNHKCNNSYQTKPFMVNFQLAKKK